MANVIAGLTDSMAYGWHLSGRVADNCIGTAPYGSNPNSYVLHAILIIFPLPPGPYCFLSFQVSPLPQVAVDLSMLLLSAIKIMKGTGSIYMPG